VLEVNFSLVFKAEYYYLNLSLCPLNILSHLSSLYAAHFCEFSGKSAIVLELINGITGRALRPRFLRAMITLCDLFGIRFIFDESLTGFRCGDSLASVVPDLGMKEPDEIIASNDKLIQESIEWLRSWSCEKDFSAERGDSPTSPRTDRTKAASTGSQ
jgi:hypothetical protein